jgi:hypothetical protein
MEIYRCIKGRSKRKIKQEIQNHKSRIRCRGDEQSQESYKMAQVDKFVRKAPERGEKYLFHVSDAVVTRYTDFGQQ